MGFSTAPGEPMHGQAIYLQAEHSITWVDDGSDFAGLGRGSFDCALEIGTLTLAVRSFDGRVGFPEGYHPNATWVNAEVAIPVAKSGALYRSSPESLPRGGAVGLADVEDVATEFDPSTGWMRIALAAENVVASVQPETIEFCDGVIAELMGPRLVGLWIDLRTPLLS